MIVLAFDTATLATTVGLRLADGTTLSERDAPGPDEHPGHATRLLGMIDELLARAGIGWERLERIGVGLGPGRFTGLRVGVATARGLAHSRALELVGFPTLAALAAGARRTDAEESERVLAVIDALRGEVFAGAYESGTGRALREEAFARALDPAALAELLTAAPRDGPPGRAAPGAGAGRWLAIGDGAVRYRAELVAAGAEVPAESSPLHALDGAAICDLAARARPVARYEDLLPDYRRVPDAARMRASGQGAKPTVTAAEAAA